MKNWFPKMPLRDQAASYVMWFALNVVATKRFRDRMTRVIKTGDPQEYVTVESIFDRPDASDAPSTGASR